MIIKILGTIITTFILGALTKKAILYGFSPYVELLPRYQTGITLLSFTMCIPFSWPLWSRVWNLICIDLSSFYPQPVPLVLDSSSLVDGRVFRLIKKLYSDFHIIIPKYVIEELHNMAENEDRVKRAKGRRGLDIVDAFQNDKELRVTIDTSILKDIKKREEKIILHTKRLRGKLVTVDYNLTKLARIEKVEVINLNELLEVLKPSLMPGEKISLQIVKKGENPHQGVGFLPDGTMVVVEEGESLVGEEVEVQIKSILQRATGYILFGDVVKK